MAPQQGRQRKLCYYPEYDRPQDRGHHDYAPGREQQDHEVSRGVAQGRVGTTKSPTYPPTMPTVVANTHQSARAAVPFSLGLSVSMVSCLPVARPKET